MQVHSQRAAEGSDELALSVGDVLTVRAALPNGWARGVSTKGAVGAFPLSFTTVVM